MAPGGWGVGVGCCFFILTGRSLLSKCPLLEQKRAYIFKAGNRYLRKDRVVHFFEIETHPPLGSIFGKYFFFLLQERQVSSQNI